MLKYKEKKILQKLFEVQIAQLLNTCIAFPTFQSGFYMRFTIIMRMARNNFHIETIIPQHISIFVYLVGQKGLGLYRF